MPVAVGLLQSVEREVGSHGVAHPPVEHLPADRVGAANPPVGMPDLLDLRSQFQVGLDAGAVVVRLALAGGVQSLAPRGSCRPLKIGSTLNVSRRRSMKPIRT